MQILIDIPDEQIEKCLEESKYLHENEGEKGSVNIVLLYTNKKLEFVDISRKTEFYSLTDRYNVLPAGHGDLKDIGKCDRKLFYQQCGGANSLITVKTAFDMLLSLPTIIESDKEQK